MKIKPEISIICPVYNEEKYIQACIESMIAQDLNKERVELLLVDGNSSDKTREIIVSFSEKYSWIKLLDNPDRVVPVAMNIGIKASLGDIIIRIDAHTTFPVNYISSLTHHLKELDADNVGAVIETQPADNSLTARSIATALSSSFGMGNSYFRIGTDKTMQVDTVPFGCFKRSVFDRFGYYDEDLIRNQDDELNGRIVKNGGKIYLVPLKGVKYYARDTVRKTRRMFYQYGLYKPLVNKKLGSPATIRQFFPLFFLLGLILGLFLSFVHPLFFYFYISVVTFYIIAAFGFALKDADSLQVGLLTPYVFINIHLAYGWGYLTGIYKIITRKSFHVMQNR